jgi:hypothetical protein
MKVGLYAILLYYAGIIKKKVDDLGPLYISVQIYDIPF